MTPEQSAKFTEYYQSVVEKGLTKLNEQEFFQKSSLAYFKMNEKQNAQGGIPIISSTFKNAFKVFKQSKSLFRRAVGSETVSEYSQRLFQNFLDGKLSIGNLEGNLNVQNFQAQEVEHYSFTPGLKVLKTDKYGTGKTTRKEKNEGKLDRVYTYKKGEQPEDFFFNKQLLKKDVYKYEGEIEDSEFYDVDKDELDLLPKAQVVNAYNYRRFSQRKFDELVQKAGFKGYTGQKNLGGRKAYVSYSDIPVLNQSTYRRVEEDINYQLGGIKPPNRVNTELHLELEKFAESKGLTYRELSYSPINIEFGKKVADAFDEIKSDINDEETLKSYKALAEETKEQYEFLLGLGYVIEPYLGKGEPYANSKEMIDDVIDNKHLYFFMTEKGFGSTEILNNHPLLQDSGIESKGKKLVYNDLFRAVHDIIGHSRGNQFGARGEENAWREHRQLYSKDAQGALTTETRGQNSWVNFGKHLRDKNNNIPKKGEKGFIEPQFRPYANQKVGLLPKEFTIDNNINYQLAPTFYSVAEKVIDEGKLRKKLNTDNPKVQRIVPILRQLGVTKEELDWLDIDFIVKGLKPTDRIPLEEVEEYIKNNLIEVHSVEFRDNSVKLKSGLRFDSSEDYSDAIKDAERRGDWDLVAELNREWEDFELEENGFASFPPTRYSEWQLEGDKYNDGELLITLPNQHQSYGGLHFNDTKNILGWVRYNIREVNGEKVFFIEEIQSDWHQTIRDKGTKRDDLDFTKYRKTVWADEYIKLAQRLKTFIDNYNKEREGNDRFGEQFPLESHEFWAYQVFDINRKEWYDWLSKEDKETVVAYKAKYSDLVRVVNNDVKYTYSERDLAGKQAMDIQTTLVEYKTKAKWLQKEAIENAGLRYRSDSVEKDWDSTLTSMYQLLKRFVYPNLYDDGIKLEPHESIELDEIDEEFANQYNRYDDASKEHYNNQNLPHDAPFKDNAWQKLVLRKILRLASEMNLDRVAWTTGKQQIDRYEEAMRQNVDKITYTKTGLTGVYANHVEIKAYKNGQEKLREIIPLEGKNKRGKTLQDYVGKSLANQIIEGEKDGEFAGDDLSIGGQGMKQSYDQNIPNYLKNYGKKWGAKLSRINLSEGFDKEKLKYGFKTNDEVVNLSLQLFQDFSIERNIRELNNRGKDDADSQYIEENVDNLEIQIGMLRDAFKIQQVEKDEIQVITQLPVTEDKLVKWTKKINPLGYNDEGNRYVRRSPKQDGKDILYKNKAYALASALSYVKSEIEGLKAKNYESAGISFLPPTSQQSINITPEMKNSVLTVGQPQFQLGGVKDDVAPLEIPDEGLSGLLNRYFFDTLGRLEEVQKYTVGDADPYLKSMLFIGRSSNRIDQFRKRFRKPFIDKLRKAGFSMRDLGDYMYAIHALERDNHIRKKDPDNKKWENVNPSGLSNEAREEILDKFEGTNIYEFVKEIQENVIKRTLELQLAEGLITQETFDSLENFFDNYVPLKGKPGITTPASGLGQGFSTPKNIIKRAFGRESTADNPFIQALIDYEKTIILAEKNKVAQELYQLIEDNPSDLWEVSGIKHIPRYDKNGELIYLEPKQLEDNEMLVKFDGKAKKIKIYDTPLLQGMKKLGKGFSLKVLRLANNYLRSVFTNMNPEFVISNFLRDSQTAFMHLSQYDQDKLKRKVYAGIPLAMKGIYNIERDKGKDNKWSDWYEEFKEQGGKMGWHDVQSVEEKIASLESEMNWDYRDNDGVVGWTKDGLKSFYDWVDSLNTSVENAVRLSTYKALVESGESKERSALLSKDLTVNFNRKGEIANYLNPLYLFFNAGLQGTNRLYRAFKHSKDVRLISGGLTLAGYLISQMNRYADPDEYEQYSDYILQNYWMILKQDGGAITMRLPYGWNVPVGLGVLAEKLHNEADYKPVNMFSDMISMFSNAFSPISGGTGLQTFAPTLTKPFVEHWENRNFMSGMIKKPQSTQRRPEMKMTWDDTPSLAKNVSEVLNRVTGGNEVKPGLIDWNPEIMNHYIRWATGGAGKFLVNSAETLNSLRKLETPEIKSTPFVRQFLKTPTEYKAKRTVKDIEYRQMSEVMNDKIRTKLEGQYAFQQKILRGKIAEELDEKVKQSYEEDIKKLEMNKYRSLIKFDLDQLLLTTTSLPKYKKLVNHYYGSHRGDMKKAYKTKKTRKAFIKEWTDKYKEEWRTE